MEQPFWSKQGSKPLFPDLEWSRPENKSQAGKLLIIGGNSQGFAAPAEAYGLAEQAGAGSVRVLLPESLRRAVSRLFPAADFAPSTPSGSFAAQALAEFCDAGLWADGVLFPGDMTRNSETTVLLENFFEKYSGQVTLTKDVADVFCQEPLAILHRPATYMVIALGQLRKLGTNAHFPRAFTSELGIMQLVDHLHEFTKRCELTIITKHQGCYVIAAHGEVSTTAIRKDRPVWRLATAARCSVWAMQNPDRSFAALTTAVYLNT